MRDLAQQRQEQPADRIAERHHQYVEQGPQAPRAADRKKVHIRDAVLEAAENERHNTEKQSQVFADLMLMIFETIDRDEDQQITEYRKNEAATQIVRQFGLTQQHRARRQRRRQPGQHQKLRGQKRPGQIAEPDERQMQCIAFVVFKQIADPPRIQMKIHRTDCEQTYGKKSAPMI